MSGFAGSSNAAASGGSLEATQLSVKTDADTLVTNSSDRTSTGTISGTTSVAISTAGTGDLCLYITGSIASSTLVFEGTIDGSTWFSTTGHPMAVGTSIGVSTITANGQWRFYSASGLAQIRVRCTVYGSGTATVTFIGSRASSAVSAHIGGRNNASITIKNAATITASSSMILPIEPCASAALVINIKASPTGTAPTLTWTIAEVDPIDQSTVTGNTVTGAVMTATGTQTILFGAIVSGTVLVSWTIGGSAGPSFTLVNATLTPSPNAVIQYNATSPTLTTGMAAVLQADSRGNEKIAEAYVDQFVDQNNSLAAVQIRTLPNNSYTPTIFTNRGANATLNVKATTGVVTSISCFNTTASVRYFQLHNTATTPAGAAVPAFSFLVPANAQIVIGQDFFTNSGFYFATGIAFGISSTMDTYTAATASDQSTCISYF